MPACLRWHGFLSDCLTVCHTISSHLTRILRAALLVLVVLMATAGKFIGCAGTARLNGIPWRESAVIGMCVPYIYIGHVHVCMYMLK